MGIYFSSNRCWKFIFALKTTSGYLRYLRFQETCDARECITALGQLGLLGHSAFPRVCFGHLTTVTASFLKLPSMPVGVVINSSEEELLHFEPLSTWLACARGTGLALFLDPVKPFVIAELKFTATVRISSVRPQSCLFFLINSLLCPPLMNIRNLAKMADPKVTEGLWCKVQEQRRSSSLLLLVKCALWESVFPPVGGTNGIGRNTGS